MIQKYSHFLNDLILERIINESVVYFSPDFRKALTRIKKDNKIASDLLELEGDDIKPDLTFIDMDDKEGYISFTTMKNAWKKLSDKYPHIEYITNAEDKSKEDRISVANQIYNSSDAKPLVYSNSRNPLKIGKFVNKALPGKYNSQDIEEFVNQFKAGIDNAAERFELVEGDDIAFWYKSENYKEIKGQLGNSCMRNNRPSTFEIYTKNPEVCKMLVLIEDGQLIGRSLIWKLKSINARSKEFPEGLYFMDRQYTIKESDVDKFRNYAKEKGWSYKTNNNHHSLGNVTYNDESFGADMQIQVKEVKGNNYHYDAYPYMDTFRRYNPMTGILYNNDDESSDYEGHYLLHDTSGGYHEIEGGVWSEWHDRTIPEDEAVWSDWADSYLHRDSAIYIDEGSRRHEGWYPDDCDDIVFDEYHDIHLHVDDAVYSNAYGYYISSDSAIEVISDVDTDGEPDIDYDSWYADDDDDIIHQREYKDSYWFKRLSDKFGNWDDYSAAVSDLFTVNYYKQYILKQFAITEYKITEPKDNSVSISGVEYLTELDAEILGYEIDKESGRKIDKFEYYEVIEEILPVLYKKAEQMLQTLRDEVDGKGQQKLKFPGDEEYQEKVKQQLNDKISKIDEMIEEIDEKIFIDFEIEED